MAHSIPAPAAPYSIRPTSQLPAQSLSKRAIRRLVRVSSRLATPWRRRPAEPSLAEQLVEDINRFGPAVMAAVEGSARDFRAMTLSDVRAELAYSAISRSAGDIPKALHDRSFPDYYIEPFHGQRNGYLSTHVATAYDSVIEWLFGGSLSEMRYATAMALGKMEKGTIVDMGTGTGSFLRMLRSVHPDSRLVGVELSPYMLATYRVKHAHELSDAHVVEASLTDTPLERDSARGVTLSFVLHELPATVVLQALREAHRVLAPGGRIAILDAITPERKRDQVRRAVKMRVVHEPFVHAFTKLNLTSLLSEAGFGPVDTRMVGRAVAVRSATKR
jgi:ubiquinone/menaquinone biosynthesis C-methylase UbiE